jgi:hypothetical protein
MWFACPRFGRRQEVWRTTKATPYVACNDCGVQMLVRAADGVRRLGRAAWARHSSSEPDDANEGTQ